jgi:hypothetical protein
LPALHDAKGVALCANNSNVAESQHFFIDRRSLVARRKASEWLYRFSPRKNVRIFIIVRIISSEEGESSIGGTFRRNLFGELGVRVVWIVWGFGWIGLSGCSEPIRTIQTPHANPAETHLVWIE